MTASVELADDRLDRVSILTTDLCNAVLHAHLAGHAVPDDQIEALVKAAMLFRDSERPWPFILEQVLQELSREDAAAEAMEAAVESSVEAELPAEDSFPAAREA